MTNSCKKKKANTQEQKRVNIKCTKNAHFSVEALMNFVVMSSAIRSTCLGHFLRARQCVRF